MLTCEMMTGEEQKAQKQHITLTQFISYFFTKGIPHSLSNMMKTLFLPFRTAWRYIKNWFSHSHSKKAISKKHPTPLHKTGPSVETSRSYQASSKNQVEGFQEFLNTLKTLSTKKNPQNVPSVKKPHAHSPARKQPLHKEQQLHNKPSQSTTAKTAVSSFQEKATKSPPKSSTLSLSSSQVNTLINEWENGKALSLRQIEKIFGLPPGSLKTFLTALSNSKDLDPRLRSSVKKQKFTLDEFSELLTVLRYNEAIKAQYSRLADGFLQKLKFWGLGIVGYVTPDKWEVKQALKYLLDVRQRLFALEGKKQRYGSLTSGEEKQLVELNREWIRLKTELTGAVVIGTAFLQVGISPEQVKELMETLYYPQTVYSEGYSSRWFISTSFLQLIGTTIQYYSPESLERIAKVRGMLISDANTLSAQGYKLVLTQVEDWIRDGAKNSEYGVLAENNAVKIKNVTLFMKDLLGKRTTLASKFNFTDLHVTDLELRLLALLSYAVSGRFLRDAVNNKKNELMVNLNEEVKNLKESWTNYIARVKNKMIAYMKGIPELKDEVEHLRNAKDYYSHEIVFFMIMERADMLGYLSTSPASQQQLQMVLDGFKEDTIKKAAFQRVLTYILTRSDVNREAIPFAKLLAWKLFELKLLEKKDGKVADFLKYIYRISRLDPKSDEFREEFFRAMNEVARIKWGFKKEVWENIKNNYPRVYTKLLVLGFFLPPSVIKQLKKNNNQVDMAKIDLFWKCFNEALHWLGLRGLDERLNNLNNAKDKNKYLQKALFTSLFPSQLSNEDLSRLLKSPIARALREKGYSKDQVKLVMRDLFIPIMLKGVLNDPYSFEFYKYLILQAVNTLPGAEQLKEKMKQVAERMLRQQKVALSLKDPVLFFSCFEDEFDRAFRETQATAARSVLFFESKEAASAFAQVLGFTPSVIERGEEKINIDDLMQHKDSVLIIRVGDHQWALVFSKNAFTRLAGTKVFKNVKVAYAKYYGMKNLDEIPNGAVLYTLQSLFLGFWEREKEQVKVRRSRSEEVMEEFKKNVMSNTSWVNKVPLSERKRKGTRPDEIIPFLRELYKAVGLISEVTEIYGIHFIKSNNIWTAYTDSLKTFNHNPTLAAVRKGFVSYYLAFIKGRKAKRGKKEWIRFLIRESTKHRGVGRIKKERQRLHVVMQKWFYKRFRNRFSQYKTWVDIETYIEQNYGRNSYLYQFCKVVDELENRSGIKLGLDEKLQLLADMCACVADTYAWGGAKAFLHGLKSIGVSEGTVMLDAPYFTDPKRRYNDGLGFLTLFVVTNGHFHFGDGKSPILLGDIQKFGISLYNLIRNRRFKKALIDKMKKLKLNKVVLVFTPGTLEGEGREPIYLQVELGKDSNGTETLIFTPVAYRNGKWQATGQSLQKYLSDKTVPLSSGVFLLDPKTKVNPKTNKTQYEILAYTDLPYLIQCLGAWNWVDHAFGVVKDGVRASDLFKTGGINILPVTHVGEEYTLIIKRETKVVSGSSYKPYKVAPGPLTKIYLPVKSPVILTMPVREEKKPVMETISYTTVTTKTTVDMQLLTNSVIGDLLHNKPTQFWSDFNAIITGHEGQQTSSLGSDEVISSFNTVLNNWTKVLNSELPNNSQLLSAIKSGSTLYFYYENGTWKVSASKPSVEHYAILQKAEGSDYWVVKLHKPGTDDAKVGAAAFVKLNVKEEQHTETHEVTIRYGEDIGRIQATVFSLSVFGKESLRYVGDYIVSGGISLHLFSPISYSFYPSEKAIPKKVRVADLKDIKDHLGVNISVYSTLFGSPRDVLSVGSSLFSPDFFRHLYMLPQAGYTHFINVGNITFGFGVTGRYTEGVTHVGPEVQLGYQGKKYGARAGFSYLGEFAVELTFFSREPGKRPKSVTLVFLDGLVIPVGVGINGVYPVDLLSKVLEKVAPYISKRVSFGGNIDHTI